MTEKLIFSATGEPMNKIDFLPINDKFTRQIEQLYETELNTYVKKILSFDSGGVFFVR
jgi:hypothetical protein